MLKHLQGLVKPHYSLVLICCIVCAGLAYLIHERPIAIAMLLAGGIALAISLWYLQRQEV